MPSDAYVRPRTPVTGGPPPVDRPPANGFDRPVEDNVRGFELAISTLAAQLERADRRADRLETALADAVAAERIAAGEAAALRAALDRRRGWRLLRRLREALRPGH